jgi:hypothetical protein
MNQGPRYVRLMGKSRGQKSRATVPLNDPFCTYMQKAVLCAKLSFSVGFFYNSYLDTPV